MVDSAPSELTLEGPESQPAEWPTLQPTSPGDRGVDPGEGMELVQATKKKWWESRG
jgi:hypothetical protein